MKNPKYFVGIMVGILVVVWAILRTSDNLGEDIQKNRLGADAEVGLNVKSNTFQMAHRKPTPRPVAPQWGSFKSAPEIQKVSTPKDDKNQDLLKAIAKKVTDKMKDDKKKKKKALAKNKKRPGVKLIGQNDSRVNRALRRFDDEFKSKQQNEPLPLVFATPPAPEKSNPEAEEENTRSLQEWADLLLKKSNPSAVAELVEAYNKNELGDKEWAFTLAEQMIESENPQIRKDGLKILNEIPSAKGFVILTKHRGQYDEEEMNLEVEKSLALYSTRLSNLSILETSVQSQDSEVQIQAARYIDLSAEFHLVPRTRSRRAETQVQPVPRQRFVSTLTVLNSASQKTKNPEAKSAIDQTIVSVQEKLASTTQTQLVFAD